MTNAKNEKVSGTNYKNKLNCANILFKQESLTWIKRKFISSPLAEIGSNNREAGKKEEYVTKPELNENAIIKS